MADQRRTPQCIDQQQNDHDGDQHLLDQRIVQRGQRLADQPVRS
jgi:hypothetical protein